MTSHWKVPIKKPPALSSSCSTACNAVKASCGTCSRFFLAPGAQTSHGNERRTDSLLWPSRWKAAFVAWCSFNGTKSLCKGHKSPEFNRVVTRWGGEKVRNTTGKKAWKRGYREVQSRRVFVGGTCRRGMSAFQGNAEIRKLMSKWRMSCWVSLEWGKSRANW